MHAALSTKEFRLFQSLVHRVAGISLSDQKRALLVGRLAPRMRELEITSFGAYFDRVSSDGLELAFRQEHCGDLERGDTHPARRSGAGPIHDLADRTR